MLIADAKGRLIFLLLIRIRLSSSANKHHASLVQAIRRPQPAWPLGYKTFSCSSQLTAHKNKYAENTDFF